MTSVDLLKEKQLGNFYRLGIAPEKKFFTQHPDLYEGVVVGAHFLTYFQTSVEYFLSSLGKPFFIDPMTYVFARPLDLILRDAGRLRGTYEKLLNIYGDEIKNIVGDGRSLTPGDFTDTGGWNDDLINELCTNVLDFQRRLLELKRVTTLDMLLELAELPKIQRRPNLLFLVPPYFYAESLSDEWYDISLEIAKRSNELKEDMKLYPVICISKQMLLSEDRINRITEDYRDFDGVIIWFSGLQDESDGIAYLRGLARLVTAFSNMGKPIFSLYGGYFFALLSKIGLTGFSSSICYGTSKHVDTKATGGGMPLRYYIPTIQIKASELDARAYYPDHLHHFCDCTVCSEVEDRMREDDIDRSDPSLFVDEFFKRIDIDTSKLHFMECRYNELLDIAKTDINELIERLRAAYQEHTDLGRDYGKNLDSSHLRTWADVLDEVQ